MTEAKKPHFGQTAAAGYAPGGSLNFSIRIGAATPGSKATGFATAPALPEDPVSCNAKGNEWLLARKPLEAIRAYDRAIALRADYVDPHFNRASALLGLGRNEEALRSFDQSIALSPGLVVAHYNRGVVLQGMKRVHEAMESYRTVLTLDPAHLQAGFNLGCLHLERKEFDQALARLDRVAENGPHIAEVQNNRGVALLRLGRDGEAIASFDRAISLNAGYAEAYNNRGEAYLRMMRFDEAARDIRRAIELQPQRGEPRVLMGRLLKEQGEPEQALEQFYLAKQSGASLPMLSSQIINAKVHSCLWANLEEEMVQLRQQIAAGAAVVEPFLALSLFDEPALHLRAARLLVQESLQPLAPLGPLQLRSPGGKIRVGYYSADFRNHPVAYLMAELFEVHDRERFEWFGFYVGPDVQDPMRQRVGAAFDHFIEARGHSDREIAQLSREMGIDIAVDLMGFTQATRMGCFAYRCAPIQVSFMGYPGTTGADYMDYVIADKVLVPPPSQLHFAEKLVYMPHTYQVNDSQRALAQRDFSREELGLPATGFVFCCFNNNFKIMPATFDGWMRILAAVPGSVLWLFESSATAAHNLRKEAQARGISADRLVFASRVPLDQHLARQRVADLFLDTLPYNAHTTASDALWAGLPVLTCMGQSFASRVGASLLHAVGLPEMVTQTQADFEARAIALAHDAAQLARIRSKLQEQRSTSPLFDARLFARHIESAYVTMHDRLHKGQVPDVIEV